MKMAEAKLEAIIQQIERKGYHTKDKKAIISVWELADNLNNYWKTPLFLKKEETEYSDTSLSGNDWALKHYALTSLFKPILETVKKHPNLFVIEEQSVRKYHPHEKTTWQDYENTFIILKMTDASVHIRKGKSYWLKNPSMFHSKGGSKNG